MKKLYQFYGGVKSIFLALYLWFIFAADVYISEIRDSSKTLLYIFILLLAVASAPCLCRLFGRLSIKYRAILNSPRKKCPWFCGFLLAALAVFGVYYIAYYPGNFSADSITQYKQVMTGEYNDWHPVLHTLLGFKFPLTVTGGWNGSIVLFQSIAFSIAVAYASFVILKYSNIPYAVMSLAFILLNPLTMRIGMYPWKDTAFAITAVLAAAYAANVYFTKGEWLRRSRVNIVASVAVLALASVFRHNGLLFTVPILIVMLLYLNRKLAIAAGACFIAAIVLIEGPLYALLKVEKPGNRLAETLGLPVSIIGEVAARNPFAMSEDMREFIYKVAPANYWTDYYRTGMFNSVKFLPETDYGKIDEEGALKVLSYTLYSFTHSPKEAFRAIVASTDIVYTVTGDTIWADAILPYIVSNDVGIEGRGNSEVREAIGMADQRITSSLKPLFWYLGTWNLILIICVLSKLRFRRKSEWKRILMVLSMLIYNFGTMLLLSGDDIRLFFYSFIVIPLMLLIVMREKRDDSVPDTPDI